ncbi:MAG: hypothetical protein NUV77_08080 [Thermoguttaceae bacterium]|jgi:hypothetical protein|nr:hypothetical protein [Thermoguttaceae bacterium]
MPPLIQIKSQAYRLSTGSSAEDVPQLASAVAGLCDHVSSLASDVSELTRQVCAVQLLLVDLQTEVKEALELARRGK